MVGRQQTGLANSPIWALVVGGVKLMPCDFEARRPGALLGLTRTLASDQGWFRDRTCSEPPYAAKQRVVPRA